MTDDLWEAHAGWWQDGLHRRRRPRVRGADPPAGRRAPGRRRARCSTSGAARARSPGWRARRGRRPGRRRRPDVGPGRRGAGAAAGARPTPAAAPRALPFADGVASTRSSPASCSSTSRDVDDAIAEVARVLRPRRPVRSSSSTTRCCRRRTAAGSTTRSSTRPSSTGASALPRRGRDDRGGGEGRAPPVHPPAAQPLRQRHGRHRPADPPHGGAGAAAGLPRPGRASTTAAATIPRLLLLRGRSEAPMTPMHVRRQARERVRRHHRAVRRRPLAGGRRPRGPRLVRHRQPAARAHRRRWPSWPRPRARTIDRVALVVGTGALRATSCCPRSTRCGRTGRRVRVLFLDAADRRARAPLRGHPPPPPARRRATERWPRPSSASGRCSSR